MDLGKIWIVGAYGRVGSEIGKLLNIRDFELLKTDFDDVDITSQADVMTYADINRPNIIINCAGMTDVEQCEKDIETAFKVNALGARNLSVVARKLKAILVQLSTDDVFDGVGNHLYNEFDVAAPITIYGKSKLAGENFVKELAPKHIIIRSSWVYGEANNFVTSIINLAKTETEIKVSDTQYASPTSAKELAKIVLRLLQGEENGIYHAVCQGICSRAEFAEEILRLMGKSNIIIVKTVNPNMPMTTYRPSYVALDNLMLRMCNIPQPMLWKEALREYMQETGYYVEN